MRAAVMERFWQVVAVWSGILYRVVVSPIVVHCWSAMSLLAVVTLRHSQSELNSVILRSAAEWRVVKAVPAVSGDCALAPVVRRSFHGLIVGGYGITDGA